MPKKVSAGIFWQIWLRMDTFQSLLVKKKKKQPVEYVQKSSGRFLNIFLFLFFDIYTLLYLFIYFRLR